ncbi:MAG: peptidoglycan editing factor PgeF [Proteobacteria bacterium]|nr:peptidoglycan editing factor PgeF [Pseudomonadota bacterium]
MSIDLIKPDWDAPPCVHALVTTRVGGKSAGPYAGFNLAVHVGDDPAAVASNRVLLRQPPFRLPAEPLWLQQVHGTGVLTAEDYRGNSPADACLARSPGLVCAVLTADCLPLLFCADDASVIAAAHAGWRGLAAGVIETSVAAMAIEPERLLAWLGPAIGPTAFEVSADVREAFCRHDAAAEQAFMPRTNDKWLCDLYLLGRQRLARLGVRRVSGGECCTFGDAQRFYSYRRDGITGRMASCIWLER